MDALFHHPAPTAACVSGHAIAGGCVLAMCCDVVVASSDPRIRIGLNETALGLPLPPRVTALARYRLPPGALERVVMGAGLHSPEEARSLGLVDLVADDAAAATDEALARLASHPRAAYAMNKRQLRAGALVSAGDGRMGSDLLSIWSSPEARNRALAALTAR